MLGKLLNSKGVALVQIIMVFAFVISIALIVSRLGEIDQKTQRTTSITTEIFRISQLIEKNLLHMNSCRWSLGDNTSGNIPANNRLGTLIPGAANAKNLNELIDIKGRPFLIVDNDKFSPYLIVKEIKVERGDGFASPPFITPMQIHEIRISVRFEKKDEGGMQKARSYSARELTKYFHVNALFNGASEVIQCHSQHEQIVENIMNQYCLTAHGPPNSYNPATFKCNNLKSIIASTSTATLAGNGNATTAVLVHDFCALSTQTAIGRRNKRVKRECELTKVGANWRLRKDFNETRSNQRCSVSCFDFEVP